MKAKQFFGWTFVVLWLGGIQYYLYLYQSREVFWMVLITWIVIFAYVFWKMWRPRPSN